MLREAGGPLVGTGAQPGPPIPSPPSFIQSHHACGHQGFRQKEACNRRGSLITNFQAAVNQVPCPTEQMPDRLQCVRPGPAWAWQGVLQAGRVNYPERFHLTSPAVCRPCPGLCSLAGLGQAPSACTAAGCLPAVSSDMSRATGSRSLASCPHWLQGCLLWLLAGGFPSVPLQTPQDP